MIPDMNEYYLDNAATTIMDDEVLDVMMPYLQEACGNPASAHEMGLISQDAVEHARQLVADLIAAEASEIYFTSGGTESNNWVIKCVKTTDTDVFAVSAVEHSSILASAECITTPVKIIPVTEKGVVDLEKLKEILEAGCKLVSIQYANNETGILQPVREISTLCKAHGVLFHVDATQALGKVEVDVEDFTPDFMSMSAHKMHGPNGIGALYIKAGMEDQIDPFMSGGGHESSMRAGTPSVASIVGFGRSCVLADRAVRKQMDKIRNMMKYFAEDLKANGFDIYTDLDNCLPNILSVGMGEIDGGSAAGFMAKNGVYVSTGSACSDSGPSHVLKAMGIPILKAEGVIRISSSRITEKNDLLVTAAMLLKARKFVAAMDD